MIIPVFKDISCEDFYEVSLSPRDNRVYWLQDCPKLNFNLVEDNYINQILSESQNDRMISKRVFIVIK